MRIAWKVLGAATAIGVLVFLFGPRTWDSYVVWWTADDRTNAEEAYGKGVQNFPCNPHNRDVLLMPTARGPLESAAASAP